MLYNCLCPKCASIFYVFLGMEADVIKEKCPNCGNSAGLKLLPKKAFGT